MEREHSPEICEWLKLPFGMTSNPCCVVYTLQQQARDHKAGIKDVMESVLCAFIVDNCLQSFHSPKQPKELVGKLLAFLAVGGIEIQTMGRQH